MTLTDLMPTLRRSIPDPLRAASWPDHTEATTTDVVIAGVSMLRLAELCATPCVHTGERTIAARRAGGALRTDIAVVIARVVMVVTNADADRVVLIDACLEGVEAVWSEMRLIGRASTAGDAGAILLDGNAEGSTPKPPHVALPGDLRAGDLLLLPCVGTVSLHQVRPSVMRRVAGR